MLLIAKIINYANQITDNLYSITGKNKPHYIYFVVGLKDVLGQLKG
jgi:hypothetical protein